MSHYLAKGGIPSLGIRIRIQFFEGIAGFRSISYIMNTRIRSPVSSYLAAGGLRTDMRTSPLEAVTTWPAVTNGVSPYTRFTTAAVTSWTEGGRAVIARDDDDLTNGGRETMATWPGLTNGIFAVSPSTGEAVAECKMLDLLLLPSVAAVVYRWSLLLARSLAVLIIFTLEGAVALSWNKNQYCWSGSDWTLRHLAGYGSDQKGPDPQPR